LASRGGSILKSDQDDRREDDPPRAGTHYRVYEALPDFCLIRKECGRDVEDSVDPSERRVHAREIAQIADDHLCRAESLRLVALLRVSHEASDPRSSLAESSDT
jgi:hypothetical protein